MKKAVAAAEAITSPATDGRGPAAIPHQDGGRHARPRARARQAARRRAEGGERQWPKTHVKMTVNGKAVEELVEPRTLLIHFLRERSQPHRPAYRLRHQPLRRLHRRHRRHVGEVLHHVRGAGQRRRHPHHRRHGQCRRHAARAAGRLPRDARPAMRLLHARHDPARLPAAAGEPEPDRGGNPLRHFRQSVPLHRLPEHRQSHSIRRRQARRDRMQEAAE